MNRFLAISTLGLTALVTLNAGQIQIGLSNGITQSYLGWSGTAAAGGGSAPCTGSVISYNPGFTGCVSPTSTTPPNVAPAAGYGNATGAGAQGSAGNNLYGVDASNNTAWAIKADSSLFELAGTNSGGALSPNIGTSNQLTASNGVQFNLSNQYSPTAVGYADFGLLNNVVTPGLYELTVPVGIGNVSSVSTLLQDYWAVGTAPAVGSGTAGQSTAVTFEFDTSSGGTASPTFVTAYLTNGDDISNGVTCTMTCGSVSQFLSSYVTSDTLDTAVGSSLSASLAAMASTTNGIHEVFTPNVYTATFSGGGLTTAGAYSSVSAGSVQLDEQTFSFAGTPYANDFLVAVIVNNQMNPNLSKVDVSAVTVSQATPEPSTILLLLTGLGSIGLGAFRRRK